MLQKLIPRSEVPPGGFTFVCPETGFAVSCHSLGEMLERISNHYICNNIKLSDDWKEIVESRLCEKLPPGWCRFLDGSSASQAPCTVTAQMIVDGVENLGKLVWEIFKGSDIFVSSEEANARAEVCAKCHFNVDSSVCLGCGAMSAVINKVGDIKGNRKTNWDHMLRNCCKCGCRNDAIVHISKEILLTSETPESILKYPEWCWKRTEKPEACKNTISK